MQLVSGVALKDGWLGILHRGLGTKLLINGVQSAVFTVLFKIGDVWLQGRSGSGGSAGIGDGGGRSGSGGAGAGGGGSGNAGTSGRLPQPAASEGAKGPAKAKLQKDVG